MQVTDQSQASSLKPQASRCSGVAMLLVLITVAMATILSLGPLAGRTIAVPIPGVKLFTGAFQSPLTASGLPLAFAPAVSKCGAPNMMWITGDRPGALAVPIVQTSP